MCSRTSSMKCTFTSSQVCLATVMVRNHCAPTVGPRLADAGHVMLVGTTHIIHEELLREMARTPLGGGEDARMLVEPELATLSGLPNNIVQVALRADNISAVGPNLPGGYGGIDAGVVTCGQALFDELARQTPPPSLAAE